LGHELKHRSFFCEFAFKLFSDKQYTKM